MNISPIALAATFLLAVQFAEAAECSKIEDLAATIIDGGGSMRPLTTRELDFARGLFVAQPNTPALFPEGGSGLWVIIDGHVRVIFTRQGQACEVMGIGADGVRNFEKLALPSAG